MPASGRRSAYPVQGRLERRVHSSVVAKAFTDSAVPGSRTRPISLTSQAARTGAHPRFLLRDLYSEFPPSSVRHGVNDVVHAYANRQVRKPLRIIRVVGVLPGVADVGVVRDGHHHAAFLVEDATPLRANAGRAVLALVARSQV